MAKKVSNKTHNKEQLNNYSDTYNKGSKQHKSNADNHSNQSNPNSTAYKKSRSGK
ncbi:MAG: hypothetical protein ACRCVI_01915 [Mycoplasmoidaceae bacterium]